MNIGDFSDSRDNNFNLIRFVAAFAVLVSHAFPIASGPGTIQPLQTMLGVTLGTFGVIIFFAISGFLITQSYIRSSTVTRWMAARALRLFPALIGVLLLTVLVLGPLVTTLDLSAYAAHPESWSYFPRNVTLAKLQYPLPGVFEDNPYGPAINGSLWTLFHEVACYGFVLVAGLLGVFAARGRGWAFAALYLAFYVAVWIADKSGDISTRLVAFQKLSWPFFIGGVLCIHQNRIPLNWWIAAALAGIAALAYSTPIFRELFVLATSYWVFALAYLIGGVVRSYNRLGDYSYGVYIYAFPFQQCVAHVLGEHSPLENMLLATPPTLLFAVLSWHLIEKRSLSAKSQVSAKAETVGLWLRRRWT